jgi:stringent starvation protein B
MTSSRPYLIRAVYEWIAENSLTPQIVVDAEMENVNVPRQFVSEGRIVLNLSQRAVRSLVMGNEHIGFSARFGGILYQVSVPVGAVQAVIARENGAGMSFPEDESEPEPPKDPETPEGLGRPALRVVK